MTTSSSAGATQAIQRAIGLHQSGRIDEAAALYRQVLAAHPKHIDALYFLGMIEAQRSRFNEAHDLIRRALRIDAKSADMHSNFACVLNALNRFQDAVDSCDRAIKLAPGMPAAFSNRGNAQQSLKRYQEAVSSYDRALAINPRDPITLTNRGNVLLALQRPADAVASYDRALAIAPNYAAALTFRGQALGMLQRHDEALASLDRALNINPNDAIALAHRGNVLLGRSRHDDAIQNYDRALAIKPDDADTLTNRGTALQATGRHDDAIKSFERALQLRPDHAQARFGLCMAQLLVLYTDEDQIARHRAAYALQLQALCKDVELWNPADLAKGIGASQPFYLAYQGENDRDLQTRYGSLICEVMAKSYPPARLPAAPAPDEPIRVGIVSGYFHHHTVWKLITRGWIEQLDRRRFRVFGYHTGAREDAETAMAKAACERLVRGPLSIERWRQEILADAPHVLLYPEVGMDSVSVQLAAQRLAPVQCSTFGHPDTSGCPTLDHFLSSDLMEPADAEAHYTERLVRLPNLSFYYEPFEPQPVPLTRAELKLRPDATVYWSGQSLYKYLPQFDWVFAAIAKQSGDCQIVFIEYNQGPQITELLRQRLERAFAAVGLKASDHCVFLPRLTPPQFVAAAGLSDVVLDSIGWTGGNTTLECFNHDLPVVTMPGRFMRGRTTLAFLNMMGITETTAATLDDYVAIAVRLGRDREWRAEIKARTAANRHRLYRDRACIEALQDFLESKVRAAPSSAAR